MNADAVYLGIDLGTGGVRVVAADVGGRVLAACERALLVGDQTSQTSAEGRHEQRPDAWWSLTKQAIGGVVATLHPDGLGAAVAAVCVDGTSGTIICVDESHRPTTAGLMYNDGRAAAEAEELNDAALRAGVTLDTPISASYGIAKLLWLSRHEPAAFERARWAAHQADFIAWRLTGQAGVTDYSNALKTGVDLRAEDWPPWLDEFGAIRSRLPRVVPPGSVIGVVRDAVADEVGLPRGVKVVAGCTDGTAGFIASGASRPGEDNTTLGTTLVFKRLATQPARDPRGLVYSHKLPGGFWLPGAASNTGGEWIRRRFEGADPAALDRAATAHLPCDVLAYPLARTGERFPFKHADAAGFTSDEAGDEARRFAANLQGTAFIERWCYEALDEATAPSGGDVYATGGGARSDVWMQLRADVTGRVYHRPAHPGSAFGAAVLAAAGATDQPLFDVIRRLVRVQRTFEPNAELKSRYDALFERFRETMTRRGYASLSV